MSEENKCTCLEEGNGVSCNYCITQSNKDDREIRQQRDDFKTALEDVVKAYRPAYDLHLFFPKNMMQIAQQALDKYKEEA